MSKKKLDYKFETINPMDYTIHIKLPIENKFIKFIFSKARHRLARSKGINIRGDTEVIQRFDIDKIYHNSLKTFLGTIIKKIRKEINRDKLDILSHDIEKAEFVRNESNDWIVNIMLQGQYIDKK